MSGEERWCVVTGGRGFAARHLVEMLIKYERFAVRIADLSATVELEPHEEQGIIGQALSSGRAQYFPVDIRYKSQVILSLLILSFLGAVPYLSLYAIGFTLAFVIFYLYEKREPEIGSMVLDIVSFKGKLKANVARKSLTSKKND